MALSEAAPAIRPRRSLATIALPCVCLLLVVGTFAIAPDEQRVPIVLAALVAAAAGFAATSIGVYGGVLVPGLLLMGVDPRFAAASSLFLQVLVIPLGAGAHARLGNVTRHVAVPLIVGGMAGAFLGPFCSAVLPEHVLVRTVAGLIIGVGVVVLATLRFGKLTREILVTDVSRVRIGGVGLVAGFASGISGAGWGPIGVKLLFLLGIEPRQAIGSSLLGRVFMSVAAVAAYLISAHGFQGLESETWLLVPLFAGSLATMILGVYLVNRLKRNTAVIVVTVLSILLALPSLF